MSIDTVHGTRRVTIINPTTDGRWETFAQQHPESAVFHTTAWARVLIDAYGYEPRYHVVLNDDGSIKAGWPVMVVASRITGTRLVTLPFCDHCYPLVDGPADAELLLDSVLADQARIGASTIEVRGWPRNGTEPPARLVGNSYYRVFLREVDPDPIEFMRGVSQSARRDARVSAKKGVVLHAAHSRADVDAYVALNLSLRKRHGMLPQPRGFFDAIDRHFLQPNKGLMLLAMLHGKAIGGALFLWHRDTIYDKFAPSDDAYWQYRPNHLLQLKSLEYACEHNFGHYDMGRVGAEDEGLGFFKQRWGFTGVPLPYYYYPRPAGFSMSHPSGFKKRALGTFARVAPLPLFSASGALLYRHLG